MREQVLELVKQAAARVVEELAPDATLSLDSMVQVVPGKSPEHGDFATNAALALAKPLKRSPREVAERIQALLEASPGVVERTEIAGPGFLNFFLTQDRWHDVLRRVHTEEADYGRSQSAHPERVMVEFVSANPTGPLTIGHGRNAVLGDAIARLLEATGHEVSREYYYNDAGRQMRVLGQSLRARYLQLLGRDEELPEDGYQGEYLVQIAQALLDEVGEGWADAEESQFRERAQVAIFELISATLERLEIRFDTHFPERSLYDRGLVEQAVEDLRSKGLVFEKDGAVWLRSTDFKLDRDRVLVKSSGEPTYLLPDIAYHRDKFNRGFDRLIDILGPDHIEQFPYVQAAVGVLGDEAERIELVIYQWVNLRRDGELVKMSTRKASFVTVDEILGDVGPDAFRYFMIDRRADTHLDFDVELARERSDRNPVYKIQYAHARLCSIERTAQERGIDPTSVEQAPLNRLESPQEAELTKLIGRFPDIVVHAAVAREPQEIARYLLELAGAFNSYVSDGKRHRVLSDDEELTIARLVFTGAVRITLANGLRLLGISAPERM
ncbi:MAG: arginine--tRNA ligase [bacterium]|nr:arginine--tRNA ligase [bacterium]